MAEGQREPFMLHVATSLITGRFAPKPGSTERIGNPKNFRSPLFQERPIRFVSPTDVFKVWIRDWPASMHHVTTTATALPPMGADMEKSC